jgi:hypothetical protein
MTYAPLVYRKRSRLPSCTDQCPLVKRLLLNVVNGDIEDFKDDYEDYMDHEIVPTTLDVTVIDGGFYPNTTAPAL